MCPLELDDIGMDFCYCEFTTHSFDLKLEQPMFLLVWLERRADWG